MVLDTTGAVNLNSKNYRRVEVGGGFIEKLGKFPHEITGSECIYIAEDARALTFRWKSDIWCGFLVSGWLS